MTDEEKDIVNSLRSKAGIAEKYEADFARNIEWLVNDYRKRQLLESLPEKPLRPFKPRKEEFLSYLFAPDGLGPWVEAGVLTSPMLEDLSPKAYSAYYRHIRSSKLPDSITFPTRSEVIGTEIGGLLEGMKGSSVNKWFKSTNIRYHVQKFHPV